MVAFATILAGVGTVGTGIGILTSYHYHEQMKQAMEEKRRVGWEDLRDDARVLNTTIDDTFDPDVLFTPGMRGATVANLLRGVYESVPLYAGIREDLREPAEELQYEPENYIALEPTQKYRHYVPPALTERPNKKVLVLDGFTDTGQSLDVLENHLLEQGYDADQVRKASVYCSERAIENGMEPDFYSRPISRPFYFPWGPAV